MPWINTVISSMSNKTHTKSNSVNTVININLNFILYLKRRRTRRVNPCGASGSMRACHAAGPGSIPGRDKFPVWGFSRGFSSPVRQMSGSFRPPRSPNIIWPSVSSIIIHYGRQWPEMLTRPKTWNIHPKGDWDFRISDRVKKKLVELVFNPCGEFRTSLVPWDIFRC